MAKQNYNKLELTWIGKGEEPKLEPRILIENPVYSYGDPKSENMLIHGDNLLALKALEQDFTGKIKCIYIDPPYNTGNAFEHYDDGIEHSLWLSLLYPRLKLLRNLLAEDGVIFVQIDDNEAPYLKIMLDEVFGRSNYETTFYVKVRHEDRILREDIRYQLVIEQVLSYRKSSSYNPQRRVKTKDPLVDYEYNIEIIGEKRETIEISGYQVEVYSQDSWNLVKTNPGEGLYKQYQIRGSLITQSGSASEYYEKNLRERKESDGLGTLYKVIGMGLRGDGLGYRYIMQPDKAASKNGFYFQGKPTTEKKNNGLPYPNYYDFTDLFNRVGFEGGVEFRNGKKPEEYIRFFFEIANVNMGDFVLDSFLGSGTTAAVAHKLGFNYIGIELGQHALTHCYPRLKAVVNGEQGGITKSVDWNGGGGFKFYNLAPSLLNEDKYGNWIISKEYNAQMLASAVAKQEGFKYQPDEHVYWKQGMSSEKDFIFTTTQFITAELMDKIHEEMLPGESLLITCKSYQEGCENRHANISIKKIPHMLMGRCEFGKDDYSFNIVNMPLDEEAENWVEPEVTIEKTDKKSKNIDSIPGLFDNE
jgi:adenine-specific DNA-methyltransferase